MPSIRMRSCQASAMPQDYRSASRETGITFRVTHQERARLEQEMRELGLASFQQLCELRVLGEAKPKRKSGRQRQDERLDISA